MENDFFKYLEEKFTLSKLRNDIEHYIEYKENGENYMPASLEFEKEEKQIVYKRDDKLTLIAIRANKGYNSISIVPFIVEVAIGDFTRDDGTNYWEASKCKAEILYNEDMEMFSVDFTYRN